MTIPSLQVILFTLIFLVPGYLINSVYSLLTVRRTEIKEILLLRFLAFSTFNLSVTYPIVRILVTGNYISAHPLRTLGWFLAIIFVSPCVIGGIIGWIDRCKFIRTALGWLGVSAMSSSPAAWDEKFSAICNNKDLGRAITVTMKDGAQFAGFFGNKGSTASSDSNERDLFLETGYKYINEEWTEPGRTDGILLKGSEILAIEFFFNEEPQTDFKVADVVPSPASLPKQPGDPQKVLPEANSEKGIAEKDKKDEAGDEADEPEGDESEEDKVDRQTAVRKPESKEAFECVESSEDVVVSSHGCKGVRHNGK